MAYPIFVGVTSALQLFSPVQLLLLWYFWANSPSHKNTVSVWGDLIKGGCLCRSSGLGGGGLGLGSSAPQLVNNKRNENKSSFPII
jgi:hypothetical protein